MSSTITVRDIDPGDKSWLKREARHVGVSMEGFVRRLIRESVRRPNAARNLPRPSNDILGPSTGSSCRCPSAMATGRLSSPTRARRDRAGRLAA